MADKFTNMYVCVCVYIQLVNLMKTNAFVQQSLMNRTKEG